MTLSLIKTRFGNARINSQGYYIITSDNENNNKLLHRLIYENFYNVKLPSEIVIPHKDSNKLNNCICNLEALTRKAHQFLHTKGENNPFYGKSHSNETKEKISNSKKGKYSGVGNPFYGKQHSDETIKIISEKNSKATNTTGFYRVSKHKKPHLKQGFT